MRERILLLLVLPALAGFASPVTTWTMRGTIGTHAVGVVLALRGDSGMESGHYFYATRLADIPLTGTFDGKHLVLREPSGAVLELDLTGQKPTPPSSIQQATGMAGTWHSGPQTLPVKFGFDASYPGVRTQWYARVTDASDADFEAMVQRFVRGALRGDRGEVAASVSFPLRVNGKPGTTIRGKRELIARWGEIFTPAYLAKLRAAMPHDMFVRNGQAMVGDGAAWFDAKGAAALNP